jgi:hypothetical protein
LQPQGEAQSLIMALIFSVLFDNAVNIQDYKALVIDE